MPGTCRGRTGRSRAVRTVSGTHNLGDDRIDQVLRLRARRASLDGALGVAVGVLSRDLDSWRGLYCEMFNFWSSSPAFAGSTYEAAAIALSFMALATLVAFFPASATF